MRQLLVFLALLAAAGCGGKGGGTSSDSGPSSPSVVLSNNRALLSWSAGGGLPDGYLIEESTDGVSFTQIQTVTETSTYVDGLTTGTKYFFRLRSFNSAGNSPYSGVTTITL